MTDNLTRLATSPAHSMATVDGIVTERARMATSSGTAVRFTLTDESGSVEVTVKEGCTGGPDALGYLGVGMYAVATGRIESADHVLAAIVQFASRKATRELVTLTLTGTAAQALNITAPKAISI
ncbi:OB-fold nucleic acid binding domain-containing protein [Kitasatospora sp. NPDC088264]|uniref:OB-fold nucleic acid binding domain-containing protein n=1 Tax=Kitasatospora sp. NPDC088264 TaxID=3155296 RepID=UPI0034395E58